MAKSGVGSIFIPDQPFYDMCFYNPSPKKIIEKKDVRWSNPQNQSMKVIRVYLLLRVLIIIEMDLTKECAMTLQVLLMEGQSINN